MTTSNPASSIISVAGERPLNSMWTLVSTLGIVDSLEASVFVLFERRFYLQLVGQVLQDLLVFG